MAPTEEVHEVRSFLGLANYFRKFIQGYAKLASPLTDLTKKTSEFIWLNACQEAFDGIKWALTHAPVLRSPKPEEPFEVVSDASLQGLGAVLLQESQPVAFESRKLSPAERNYTTTEQELLGVVHALRVWRCYLEENPFTVVTDHCPNTFLQTQALLSRRQARWMEFLQRFEFIWQYRPGRTNVADPLSRFPVGPALATLTRNRKSERARSDRGGHPEIFAPATEPELDGRPSPIDLAEPLRSQILGAYASDSWLRDVSNPSRPPLSVTSEGFYLCNSRIYVPANFGVRILILQELHDSKYAGHFGVSKTSKAVDKFFWWPTLRADVKQYVVNCPVCRRNKPSHQKPAGLLQPLPVPDRPWDSVSFDFITQLPVTTKGFDAICVFVDRLTKMAHFVPTSTTVSAIGFADLWVDHVYRLHGVAKEFISNRDTRFTSKFWEEATRLLGTKLCRSTAFHPQSDGQTERTNQTLEIYLRHFVSLSHDDWDRLLATAEFAYNSAWQESVKASPFMLNFGQEARTPLGLGNAQVPAAGTFVGRLSDGLTRAKSTLNDARQRIKSFADQKRRELELEVGDSVLLSTKYLPSKSPGTRKFWPRFIGPFTVKERIGAIAYKLDLPSSLKIHPVFHVSLLSPYQADGRVQPPPPPLEIDGDLEYEVENVLDHRDRKVGNRIQTRYLVS